MQLMYSRKISEEDILLKAQSISVQYSFPKNCSLLFKSDNFFALSALLSDFTGKVDLIYIDPPFNSAQNYFLSEGRANSVSYTKSGVLAYADKLSKEEYLEFIRKRLILMRELLSEEGSIYLHIDYKIGHYVKIIMDEVFGESNFKNDIARIKSNPKNFYRRAYGNEKDSILFYAKNSNKNIWNDITIPMNEDELQKRFPKIDEKGRRYTTIPLHAPGETKAGKTNTPWRNISVPSGRHWRTDPSEFEILDRNGKIEWSSNGNPRIKKYADEHTGKKIQDIWAFKDPQKPQYPTQKNADMLERIILQSSRDNSIVLDCFAGSGSTLKAAYKLNRTWIGVDNSDVAIDIIKKNEIGDYSYFDFSSFGKYE